MPFDPQSLLDYPMTPISVTIREQDALLYALSIGFGQDLLDPRQLRYTYERDQAVFPTMPVVLGASARWMIDPAVGLDATRLVHGEEAIRLHRPLRPGQTLVAHNGVTRVVDKGVGRGALIHVSRRLLDSQGELVAETTSGYLFRGDGGFGGPVVPSVPEPIPPDRQPDALVVERIPPGAAILYRLNGDRNPLHIDPKAARAAGFSRPILHGLCTFGWVARMLLDALRDLRPDTLGYIRARFSAPVEPGETLRTEAWTDGDRAWFRTTVVERDQVVLSGGIAEFTQQP